MAKFSIEGKFLSQTLTGTQRYAWEIVSALDGICDDGEFELVVPEAAEVPASVEHGLSRIPLVRNGGHAGPLWTHVDFARYCRANGSTPLCLNNIAPLFSRAVVTIHDVSPKANKGFYSWKYRAYQDLCFWFNTRRARLVLSDTEFSKREIERYYPAAKGKIRVAPCAWQHMERVEADEGALAKYGLEPGGYWFAMSSLAPNKNLRWLVETALLNPGETVAIAGGMNAKVFGEHGIPEAGNVKYLGYVTDGEAKALMEHCKGFLFPTFYEGFGIPPMEAMASGAPFVAVGDNPCMHEVYGGSVAYVDPRVACGDLEGLANTPVGPQSEVLGRFSWEKSARMMLRLLRGME